MNFSEFFHAVDDSHSFFICFKISIQLRQKRNYSGFFHWNSMSSQEIRAQVKHSIEENCLLSLNQPQRDINESLCNNLSDEIHIKLI